MKGSLYFAAVLAATPLAAGMTLESDWQVSGPLAARFGLQYHRLSRDFEILALALSPSGPRPEEFPKPAVTRNAGRPVVDRTGLTGFYKIALQWQRNPADPRHEALLSALSSIGLDLRPQKATFPVVIVDRINREPAAN